MLVCGFKYTPDIVNNSDTVQIGITAPTFIGEVKLPDGSHLLGGLVDQEALASPR